MKCRIEHVYNKHTEEHSYRPQYKTLLFGFQYFDTPAYSHDLILSFNTLYEAQQFLEKEKGGHLTIQYINVT